jgi:hypothetical protein
LKTPASALGLLLLTARAFADDGSASDRGAGCFRASDFACAERELTAAHRRDESDLDVTLLLGITDYRLGRGRDAEPLLRAAARSSDGETAASARIFLGLLASERGDLDAAQADLGAAQQAPGSLGESARGLLQRRGAKRLQLVLLVRPEFDSNVPLFPMTPTATGSGQQADGDVLVLVGLNWRPWRQVGLSVDETASYRQQFTLLDYSLFANRLSPRYDYLGRNDRVAVGYAFELMTLGGALFTIGHLADASYRRRLVADFGIGVSYGFRHRQYYRSEYGVFTGPTHAGAAELSWGTPERPFELAAGYLVVRELAADPTFSATGHGGRLRARVRFARRFDLGFTGWILYRAFDVADATLGARRDTQLYGDLSLACDLDRRLGLIVGASVTRSLSTIADYDYLKATAHVGFAFGYARQ